MAVAIASTVTRISVDLMVVLLSPCFIKIGSLPLLAFGSFPLSHGGGKCFTDQQKRGLGHPAPKPKGNCSARHSQRKCEDSSPLPLSCCHSWCPNQFSMPICVRM